MAGKQQGTIRRQACHVKDKHLIGYRNVGRLRGLGAKQCHRGQYGMYHRKRDQRDQQGARGIVDNVHACNPLTAAR